MAITDLTGTVWRLKDTISPSPFGKTEMSAFEITGTMVSDGYSITLPYTVGAYTYNQIAIAGSIFSSEGSSSAVFRCGAYGGGSSNKGYFIVYYNKGVENLTESGWRYYTYNYSPSVPLATAPIISAPLFTITGGAGATNSKLIAWLEANATQVVILPTKITYNGTATTLEAGQTATLACAGKKAADNIVVTFGGAGGITYNGSSTEVEAGKTATLQCAGKKMTGDVYITNAKESDPLQGTWVLNDVLVVPESLPAAVNINFVSNDTNFSVFGFIALGGDLAYSHNVMPYNSSIGWSNDTFKTIVISSTYDEVTKLPISGNAWSSPQIFLSWLQANAIKQ